jgi:integrase/recombinase XerC/integrase/recombinase XerD
MTATVHTLRAADGMTLCHAADAYLATLGGAEQEATHRAYAKVLRRMTAHFGPDTDLSDITADRFAAWFREQWEDSAPSTWNAALAAVKSAVSYWQAQGWADADPARLLVRRRQRPDRSRALDRGEVERLLTDERHSLRDRCLWRLLYESAARSAEVLSLNVEDLDLPNRRAKIRRKGGAMDTIIWQTRTARLLPRLLKGRTSGPVFVTERKARVQLPAADLDDDGHARLSYVQAEQVFKRASGGATLHQLRHSALTHDAESGTSTPMLMARSGHTSVRSLARYARVSAEALARHQAEHDPARRR